MKNRQLAALVLCGGVGVLLSACATKNFVREQVGTTETRITQRVDSTETKLRETSDKTTSNTQALEAAGQRLQGLDGKLGEVGTVASDAKALAGDAKKDAAQVASAQKEAETAFNQRFANRNKYAMVETKSVFFDFNKADLKDEGINELEDVAKALKNDPNAVLELQGFADPRGTDRYNYVLTRDRVDAVVRYLVQRHNIDLRRIAAVGMGKIALAAGEKGDKDTFAKSRRVELRLLAPQS
jgi:outer membrane protein OmpA-like peptidoglycan-associated protein